MKKILFICTQNVFRSYSAHKIAENHIKQENLDVYVDSAGTHAYAWERPYSYTFETLDELNISFDYNHKNKKITKSLFDKDTIIICMTKDHQQYIKDNFGVNSFLFNELVNGEKTDLQDDVESENYDSLEDFVVNTVKYIYKNIPKLLENVQKL